jgi:hypothetical protein
LLLEEIKAYFGGVGSIRVRENAVHYEVSNVKDIINYILPHFDLYPLISKKQADYLLFKEITLILLKKEHLRESGIQDIVNRKASLNNGLSDKLKKAFPNTQAAIRPSVTGPVIPNPS